MIVVKKCAACGRTFCEERCEPFKTCGKCRIYHPSSNLADGCHVWRGAAPDPRINRHQSSTSCLPSLHDFVPALRTGGYER